MIPYGTLFDRFTEAFIFSVGRSAQWLCQDFVTVIHFRISVNVSVRVIVIKELYFQIL